MSSKSKPLLERMKHLLSTGSHADVHFLVGEGDKKELVPAHKNIMAMSSDVFAAMFRVDAENAAKTNTDGKTPFGLANPVEVPDVDIGAFKVMLNYIYLDDLCDLDGQNAMAVLYAANKYNIPGLIEACVGIPINELPNIFLAYAQAKLLHEGFAYRCLNYIDQNADALFADLEAFLQIDQTLLCELLSRDHLAISEEISIWKAALRWADKQCGQKGMECSAANRRAMFGPALHKIRFPLMPKEEFARRIVPTHVLTDKELIAVLLCHFPTDELYPLQFSTQRRASRRQPNGQIELCIDRMSELLQWNEHHIRLTSDAVCINGLSWRIYGKREMQNKKKHCLSFFLQCMGKEEGGEETTSAMVLCAATLRIVAQKEGKADYVHEEKGFFFDDDTLDCPLSCRQPFDVLMNSNNGWYDAKEDKLKVVVNLMVKEGPQLLMGRMIDQQAA